MVMFVSEHKGFFAKVTLMFLFQSILYLSTIDDPLFRTGRNFFSYHWKVLYNFNILFV